MLASNAFSTQRSSLSAHKVLQLVVEVACGSADLDDFSYAMQRATTSTSTPAPGMIQGGNTTLSSPEKIATFRLTCRRRQNTAAIATAATTASHGARLASPWSATSGRPFA